MSAYIVHEEHLRFLVDAAMQEGIIYSWWDRQGDRFTQRLPSGDFKQASRLGQTLLDENARSVDARYYDSDVELDLADMYGEHRIIAADLWKNPLKVLKACDGYEYQACEHRGWHFSEAKGFIDTLRKIAIRKLPGYTEAGGWAIDRN